MPYKVFLVEDEVTTREGIRDNVDWQSVGFELCGEAPDGEIALPQIETTQPDVLITDIKMPFMDGLQLCRIIREHWAWMKIIIISGHNDFQYAQTAIKLGASEYLLKPVSVQDLQSILAKVAVTLDQEKTERAYLKQLSRQVEDNLHLQREKFLLRLVTGGESAVSAIEQGQELGLNILSTFYQVDVFEIRPPGASHILDYETCQQTEQIITDVIGSNADALLTRAGMDRFVLIFKGENLEQISQESEFLSGVIRDDVQRATDCSVIVGAGTAQQRLGDLHRSFAEALMLVEGARLDLKEGNLRSLDHSQLYQFLERGRRDDFDAFFEQSFLPPAESVNGLNLLLHYLVVDAALATAKFISDLGGSPGQISYPRYDGRDASTHLITLDQFKAEVRKIIEAGLAFRDSLAKTDRATIVQTAKSFIAGHFSDPNLSLPEVAARVNFSPNHFSVVFSEETGSTFKDYLTNLRIDQAKKLLRLSNSKCSEVAYQVGYNDSHYFSMLFRKKTGLTPQQYRNSSKSQAEDRSTPVV